MNEELNTLVPHKTASEFLEINADGEEIFTCGPEDEYIEWQNGAYRLKPR